MRPERDESLRWFAACLAVALLPLLLFVSGGKRSATDSGTLTRQLHWSLLATASLGVFATPILNRLDPAHFTFTWPVTLFAMFQSAILASVQASRTPEDRATRRRSYLTGAGWLLTCIAFFLLLRQASLPHEWGFLIGFIPAVPVAIWAARLATRGATRGGVAMVVLLGYSAGFWGSIVAPLLLSFFM